MTTPDVVRCCDGHFRRAVYGIGPYIADYPEQALLCCIVQGWCPKFVFVFVSHLFSSCLCLTRCTAKLEDLDGLSVHTLLRSCEHTEELVKAFELGDLWDDYGLVGDIVVRFFPCIFLSRILVPLDYAISLFRAPCVSLNYSDTFGCLSADPRTPAVNLR
jgi:hypothetical protein